MKYLKTDGLKIIYKSAQFFVVESIPVYRGKNEIMKLYKLCNGRTILPAHFKLGLAYIEEPLSFLFRSRFPRSVFMKCYNSPNILLESMKGNL